MRTDRVTHVMPALELVNKNLLDIVALVAAMNIPSADTEHANQRYCWCASVHVTPLLDETYSSLSDDPASMMVPLDDMPPHVQVSSDFRRVQVTPGTVAVVDGVRLVLGVLLAVVDEVDVDEGDVVADDEGSVETLPVAERVAVTVAGADCVAEGDAAADMDGIGLKDEDRDAAAVRVGCRDRVGSAVALPERVPVGEELGERLAAPDLEMEGKQLGLPDRLGSAVDVPPAASVGLGLADIDRVTLAVRLAEELAAAERVTDGERVAGGVALAERVPDADGVGDLDASEVEDGADDTVEDGLRALERVGRDDAEAACDLVGSEEAEGLAVEDRELDGDLDTDGVWVEVALLAGVVVALWESEEVSVGRLLRETRAVALGEAVEFALRDGLRVDVEDREADTEGVAVGEREGRLLGEEVVVEDGEGSGEREADDDRVPVGVGFDDLDGVGLKDEDRDAAAVRVGCRDRVGSAVALPERVPDGEELGERLAAPDLETEGEQLGLPDRLGSAVVDGVAVVLLEESGERVADGELVEVRVAEREERENGDGSGERDADEDRVPGPVAVADGDPDGLAVPTALAVELAVDNAVAGPVAAGDPDGLVVIVPERVGRMEDVPDPVAETVCCDSILVAIADTEPVLVEVGVAVVAVAVPVAVGEDGAVACALVLPVWVGCPAGVEEGDRGSGIGDIVPLGDGVCVGVEFVVGIGDVIPLGDGTSKGLVDVSSFTGREKVAAQILAGA
jgi:hypothetical protein